MPGQIKGHAVASDQMRVLLNKRIAIDNRRDDGRKDCEEDDHQPERRRKGQEGPLEMMDENVWQRLAGCNQIRPVLVAEGGLSQKRKGWRARNREGLMQVTRWRTGGRHACLPRKVAQSQ